MRLAWSSTSLRAACISGEALPARWRQDGDVAKLLLGTLAHARDMLELRRLRCIEVQPTYVRGAPEVLISMEEVQMHAAPLTTSGARVEVTPAAHLWSHLGGSTALLVLDLQARGLALDRTAS